MSTLVLTSYLITSCLFCTGVPKSPTAMVHACYHRTPVGLVSQYDVKYYTGSAHATAFEMSPVESCDICLKMFNAGVEVS